MDLEKVVGNDSVLESYFWSQIKTGLESEFTHLSRIENTAGSGVADVTACHSSVDVWLELKIFHKNKLQFRNSQGIWIRKRSRVGGRIFVLARRDHLSSAQMLLYKAIDVVEAPSKPLPEKKSFLVDWDDLPDPIYYCDKPFKWTAIHEHIFNVPG